MVWFFHEWRRVAAPRIFGYTCFDILHHHGLLSGRIHMDILPQMEGILFLDFTTGNFPVKFVCSDL